MPAEASGLHEHRPGQHGADHEEVAVRDIDDVEQAEDDRQAQRDQRDDQTPNEAVDREDKNHLEQLRVSSGGCALADTTLESYECSRAGERVEPAQALRAWTTGRNHA